MTTKEYSIATERPQSSVLTTGLALFAMFFGAGNLIFPILIGKAAGTNTWYAISGLAITAVIVPFLGLASMVLFGGDYRRFFGRVGNMPGFVLFLILQLILGPFGVIPRLVTLMYAMAKPYLFNMPLMVFSFLTVAVIFACSFKREYLIRLVGSIMTPIKLLSLAALVGIGLMNGTATNPVHSTEMGSFQQGLFGGYNTMDLIAAFVFATLIIPHFQRESESELPALRQKFVLKKMFFASLIASSLLLLTYIGLAWISSYHSWTLDPNCPPEEMLGAIAYKILGPAGGCIAAVAVIMACLTTAITLATCFAEYLQKDLCKGKISSNWALILTLIATTLFANLGFSGILAFLSPILQVVYPGLILLSGLNILHSLYGFKMVKTPVFLAFISVFLYCL